jgi:hypothetical protein
MSWISLLELHSIGLSENIYPELTAVAQGYNGFLDAVYNTVLGTVSSLFQWRVPSSALTGAVHEFETELIIRMAGITKLQLRIPGAFHANTQKHHRNPIQKLPAGKFFL